VEIVVVPSVTLIYEGRCGAVESASEVRTTTKPPVGSLSQNTLPSLLCTGWFQEQIRTWLHNRSKINWALYGRLIFMLN